MIDDFLLNQYWSLSIPPENKKELTVFLRFFRMGGGGGSPLPVFPCDFYKRRNSQKTL